MIVYKLFVLKIVTGNYNFSQMIQIISYLKSYNCLEKTMQNKNQKKKTQKKRQKQKQKQKQNKNKTTTTTTNTLIHIK